MSPVLSRIIVFTLAAVSISMIGILVFMQSGEAKSADIQTEDMPVYVEIETVAVNLQPENGDHIIQLRCVAQLADRGDEELFKQSIPEIRDRIILLISDKKPSDISDKTGKTRLQQEILAALRAPFKSSGETVEVEAVHFTSLIVE